MCGRFANAIPSSVLTEYFSLSEAPAIPPRWNIAPTQIVPIIKQDEGGRSEIGHDPVGHGPTLGQRFIDWQQVDQRQKRNCA